MFDGAPPLETDPAERRARLRLARSARIGPVTFHEALQHFGSARAACDGLATVSDAAIAREEEALARSGGRFLVVGDPAYPAALAALPDAPPVLSAMGDIELLSRPILAVVGAREASAAGCRFAAELAATLGAAGFVVASGLARGIDAAAHEAALATGTVAVLAGGIDQIYPPQNAALHGGDRGARTPSQRSAPGHAAGRPRLPAAQPHRERPVGRGGGDRGGRPVGLPDHRPPGRRTGPRGLRRAGLADGPALRRIQ